MKGGIDIRKTISHKLSNGMDINTQKSTYRIVKSINDYGIYVPVGKKSAIWVTWDILNKCYSVLCNDRYDGQVFRELFPILAYNKPCYVHTIGQIFVVCGLAKSLENYYIRT
jgi:hypothetical protein